MIVWTDELCTRLYATFISGTKTWAQLAADVGAEYSENVNADRLRSALRRWIARRDAQMSIETQYPELIYMEEYAIEEDDARFPEPARITEQEILVLDDPNVLILGDIHAPFHSPEMLERAVTITKKYFPHIKHCMIIGDLFDFGAISNHVNNQPVTSAETDMRAGGRIARILRDEFELWINSGNHDERLSKKINSEFSMTSLLCGALGNKDAGLHLTDLDYMFIGNTIIAGHPSLYSAKPTGIASKIALLQRKNIITGHSHKTGITMSDDGEHWTVDNGHCASEELFYYGRRRLNTFGKSGAGFTVISNARPFVFGEMITDWEFWR